MAPTESLKAILDRDMSIAEAKDMIVNDCSVLREIINYATNALSRCMSSCSSEANVDIAVFLIYLHMIEMTDGIEVLTSQASFLPAVPIVRSSFESLLSLEFALEQDTRLRSLTWLLFFTRRRLDRHELFDPDSRKGEELGKAVVDDELLKKIPAELRSAARNQCERYQDLLKRPEFYDLEQKRCEEKPRYWYQLCNREIGHLRQLAVHLGREAQYITLYKHWSGIVHGTDIGRYIDHKNRRETAIEKIRNPENREKASQFAAMYMLQATELLIKKYRQGEFLSFANWYKKEVRTGFREMNRLTSP